MMLLKTLGLTLWLMSKDISPWLAMAAYAIVFTAFHAWFWDVHPFGGFVFTLFQTLALVLATGLIVWFDERWACAKSRLEEEE